MSLNNENNKLNRAEENGEKMDLLMRAIKAVHSSAANPESITTDDLEKLRNASERYSKLITPVVGIKRETIDVSGIDCEWLRPAGVHRQDRVILYCHGGGYINGGLGYAAILGGKLAQHTGIDVLTFAYRLAPENPYPAAIEDVVTVWNYLMYLGYGAGDVYVAGDSSGGNLALELCLDLKKNLRKRPGALILISPWTDMSASGNSYNTYKDKDPMLTYEYIASARSAYAGTGVDYALPQYSPLFADLSDMPPALIQVGSNEILRDDSEKLFKNYTRAGNLAKLEVCPGGWHVYQQLPIPKATKALERINDYLTRL